MQGTYLDAGGVRTYCIDRGRGPPMVLLHGAAVGVDAYSTWFRTIRGLEDAFRLVGFDQIGFGRTDMPADGIYRNRLERVDHAIAVLGALGIEKAVLVGHSEGGFMAARIAIVEPSLAARVVIVTSGGTAPYLGGEADRVWMAASRTAYNSPGALESEEAFIEAGRFLSRRRDAELERIMRDNYRRAMATGQDRLFANMRESDADIETYGHLQEEHVLPHLSDLDVPMLLVWSTEDRTVPVARGLELLARAPRAELHVFRDAAHNVMHDQSERFNRLLRGWCQ